MITITDGEYANRYLHSLVLGHGHSQPPLHLQTISAEADPTTDAGPSSRPRGSPITYHLVFYWPQMTNYPFAPYTLESYMVWT